MFKISTENDNFIILYLELVLYLWLTRCLLLFRQSYIHSIYPSWCGRRALCAGLPDCRHRDQYNSLGPLLAVHRWYMVQTSKLIIRSVLKQWRICLLTLTFQKSDEIKVVLNSVHIVHRNMKLNDLFIKVLKFDT